MMEVIIIEDEPHAASKLERQLFAIEPTLKILAKLETVDSAVDWLKNHDADLIFLDIHLGDALSFDIFNKVDVKTPIIFTTAYDQYAIQAFKLNSIDYLLKPVNKKDLETAMDKFKTNQLDQQNVDFSRLVEALKGEVAAHQKRFMVHTGDKIKSVPVEDVAYFFAEGKYCYLISRDNIEYLVDQTLDKLEQVLDASQFFRINRQFIISLAAIEEMYTYPKGRVKVILNPRNKRDTIVSVERSPDFKKWLNN